MLGKLSELRLSVSVCKLEVTLRIPHRVVVRIHGDNAEHFPRKLCSYFIDSSLGIRELKVHTNPVSQHITHTPSPAPLFTGDTLSESQPPSAAIQPSSNAICCAKASLVRKTRYDGLPSLGTHNPTFLPLGQATMHFRRVPWKSMFSLNLPHQTKSSVRVETALFTIMTPPRGRPGCMSLKWIQVNLSVGKGTGLEVFQSIRDKSGPAFSLLHPCLNSVPRTTAVPSGTRLTRYVHPVVESSSHHRPSSVPAGKEATGRADGPAEVWGQPCQDPSWSQHVGLGDALPWETRPRKSLPDGQQRWVWLSLPPPGEQASSTQTVLEQETQLPSLSQVPTRAPCFALLQPLWGDAAETQDQPPGVLVVAQR